MFLLYFETPNILNELKYQTFLQNIIQTYDISVKLLEQTKTAFQKFTLNMRLPISADHNMHSIRELYQFLDSIYIAFLSTLY